MVFAIVVLLVSSLLVAAAFVAANGDVKLTHANTSHKKAYYAALAGIAAYKDAARVQSVLLEKMPAYTDRTGKERRRKPRKAQRSNEEEYVVKTVPTESSTVNTPRQNAKAENSPPSFRQKARPPTRFG